MDRLRRQADVPHHRDLGLDDRIDHRHPLATSLQLHGLSPGPDEGGRVAHGVLDRDVVAEPREIAHDHRTRSGAGHRPNVVGHVVHGDLQRVVVAEHDHGHRVADQDEVDAALVGDAGTGRVVRGHHHERIAGPLAGADRGRGQVLSHRLLLPRPAPRGCRR